MFRLPAIPIANLQRQIERVFNTYIFDDANADQLAQVAAYFATQSSMDEMSMVFGDAYLLSLVQNFYTHRLQMLEGARSTALSDDWRTSLRNDADSITSDDINQAGHEMGVTAAIDEVAGNESRPPSRNSL